MANETKSARVDIMDWLRGNIRTGSMVIALVLLWVVFGIVTDGNFTTIRNLSNVLRQMTILGIMGCGMVLVIASENIDLSVGSAMGFISVLAAHLMRAQEFGVVPTIITALAVGTAIGILNGLIIAYLQVPSFIVTLGGLFIYRGALYGVGRGESISPLPPSFQVIGQGSVSPQWGMILAAVAVLALILATLNTRRSRGRYGLETESVGTMLVKLLVYAAIVFGLVFTINQWKGIPIPLLIAIGVVIVLTFVAERTALGRRIYAIGFNKTAARYSGLPVRKTIAVAFTINGLLAGVAAIVYGARLNAGIPTAGQYMELDVIAAAIIGGASLTGGVGKVWGALLGALIMATVTNGMSILDVKYYYLFVVKGLVIILAVWFDVYMKRKTA